MLPFQTSKSDSANNSGIKAVFKNVSWLTLQDVIVQPLGFIFFTLLGRILGDEGLGTYSYILTIGTFFSYILDFGLTTFFWRRWALNPEDFKTDLPLVFGYKLVLLVPFSILFFLYVILFERSNYILFILIYVLFIIESLRSIPMYFAQATNDFKNVFRINVFDKLFVFILCSILLVAGYGMVSILVTHIIFRLLSTVYAFHLFKQPFAIRMSLLNLVSTLKPSLILFLIQMLSILFFRVDTVMIRFAYDLDAVGLYSAAYKLIETSLIIPNIALAAVFSSVIRWQKINQDQSNSVLSQMSLLLIIVGLLGAVIIQLHAPDILYLIYGDSFQASTLPLQWLGWCLPFLFVNTILITKMLALDKDKDLLFRAILLIIINIVLNWILLPRFFISGAAIATLTSEIFNLILLIRLTSLKLPTNQLIKICLAAISCLVLGSLSPLYFMITILLEVVIFFVLIIFLKVFSLKNVIELKSL